MSKLFDIEKLKERALNAPASEYRNAIENLEKLYRSKLKTKEEEVKQLKRDFSSLKDKINKSKQLGTLKVFKKYESLKLQHEKLLSSSKNKKDRLHNITLEHRFLIDRVILKYGAQAYLDLINSADSPRGIPLEDLAKFKKKHGLEL